MNKEFIPYEQALELKELGFDEPYYFATYLDFSNLIPREEEDGWELSKGIIAPLYQQAFRWFREKYEITAEVSIEQYRRRTDKKWMFSITYLTEDAMYEHSKTTFISYEEAELACLNRLIEIVKLSK